MDWIERIERRDGRLVPVFVNSVGARRIGSLHEARLGLPRSGYRAATVEGAPLHEMEATDASEYLDAIGLAGADPSGHQVFALSAQGQRILIPAVLVLLGLLGNLAAVGDCLLEAGSLDRVALPVVFGDQLRVRFYRHTRLCRATRETGPQARFAWLTCHSSARRFWHSVYTHATEGRLGLDPAKAMIDATFYGRKVRGTVIATRMSVNVLSPGETPLPFAAPYVERRFDFNARGSTGAANLGRFRARGQPHPSTKRETDIPLGPDGWKMSDAEWKQVCDQFKRAGFAIKSTGKDSVDIMLEKFGAGTPWSAMGPRGESARAVYKYWVPQGRWDLLKRLLADLRSESS